MHVIDLEGNPYPCQATITQDLELNGNQTLSASILPTKVNQAFIDDIEQMWNIVDHDNVEYKIIYAKRKGKGKLLSVDIKAIPLFFDELDNDRIYEEYNEHMTAQRCFNLIFEDTNFNFVLVGGGFLAVEWEGFGAGESKLESFKRAIERYKAEFRIQGNTVYLEHQIGRDTQFQYRHRLNASNIVQENDAAEMWTYAKGYGDYDDAGEDETGEDTGGWQNARLIREYTSPLASVIGIRHAPPIKNGKIKLRETMDEALKTLVDESLKISVSADIHDLRAQGYPLAQPQLGDRVFLIDERIGLKAEVRAVNMNITRNWKGDVIDLQLTFGTPNLMKRYQSNLNTATKIITDALEGKRKLPVSVLDDVVQEVTAIIKGNDSSVFRYMTNGVIGWNGDDPNYMTRYVGDAIGFSDDGGATFETAMSSRTGINANVIRTGTMLADRIGGGILSSLNGNTHFNLNNGMLDFFNDASIRFNNSAGGVRRIQNGRSAILSFPISAGSTTPMAAIGVVNQTGTINVNDPSFRGIRLHGDNVSHTNDLVNDSWTFTRRIDQSQGSILFNLGSGRKGIFPQYTGSYDYDLGSPNNKFNELHVGSIKGAQVYISNPFGLGGWSFETQPEAGSVAMTFRGINSGSTDFVYNLGSSANPFNFGRINHLRPTGTDHSIGASSSPYNYVYTDVLVEGSDESIKEEIFDNELGYEFLKDIHTVNFKYMHSDQYKTGVIAQHLAEVLQKHGVDLNKQSMVMTDDEVMGVAYTQLVAPIIKAIQELGERLEVLENGTATA